MVPPARLGFLRSLAAHRPVLTAAAPRRGRVPQYFRTTPAWQPAPYGAVLSGIRLYSTIPGDASKPDEPAKPSEKSSLAARLLPFSGPSQTTSSFRKIVSLAKPEKRPLTAAVGLLLISSSVGMSIPFTVGRLIDFFSTSNPVIPLGLSIWQAAGAILFAFTAGAAANAGRAMLMKMAGESPSLFGSG